MLLARTDCDTNQVYGRELEIITQLLEGDFGTDFEMCPAYHSVLECSALPLSFSTSIPIHCRRLLYLASDMLSATVLFGCLTVPSGGPSDSLLS